MRNYIASNAARVKEARAGECHTFAQFATDHLLTLIETGIMKDENIKIVTSERGRSSHTFLLIGHNEDDLNDLSKCLIIDPWAVTMGYDKTHGIFTGDDYPYPNMLSKLKCVYESARDKDHLAKMKIDNSPTRTERSYSMPTLQNPNASLFSQKKEPSLQKEKVVKLRK